MLLKGNCLETLKTLADNSVDSIVTDPPYELGFMGKSWDASGIAYNQDLWAECLRVLKPGGHLLAFSGSRTYHRMTVAIEDAGFEIRDQIMWLYGSGFPKSLDVSKAIDKAAGAEREVTATKPQTGAKFKAIADDIDNGGFNDPNRTEFNITAPATPEAQRWQGWGTALKPAHEPICVARKPLTGTVASNVLEWGTGALNIDGSRVGKADGFGGGAKGTSGFATGYESDGFVASTQGRWPANVIHDGSDEVLAGFPNSKGGAYPAKRGQAVNTSFASGQETEGGYRAMGDDGSAARFFYCAKASKSERNAGLDIEHFPLKNYTEANKMGGAGDTMLTGSGNPRDSRKQNFHPTVKPLALMRYLVKLVTPPNGTVLDPFLGSGSTAVACVLEGFDWVGCEMTEDYWPIIEARVEWAHNQPKTLL